MEEVKEEVIRELQKILKNTDGGLRKHRINFLLDEIRKCHSNDEVIETVYEWENEAYSYYSRGETEVYYFQKEMYQRISSLLP